MRSDVESRASRLEKPRSEIPRADATHNHATNIRRRETRTKGDWEPESAMNTNLALFERIHNYTVLFSFIWRRRAYIVLYEGV